MKSIVVDNFFDDFSIIKESIKQIPLYNLEEYKTKFNRPDVGHWPGMRSDFLENSQPFLFALIMKEFNTKYGNVFNGRPAKIWSHTHLRLSKDEPLDYVHADHPASDYSFLIYISNTNLNSGTGLYDNNSNLINDIKFVENRSLLFDSRYLHRSIGNHGNNVNDGRLTINIFFKFK